MRKSRLAAWGCDLNSGISSGKKFWITKFRAAECGVETATGSRVMQGEFTGGVHRRGRGRRRGIGEGRLARDPEFGIVREFNCFVDPEITNSRKSGNFQP